MARFIKEEEFKKIMNSLESPRDRVMLGLVYEGFNDLQWNSTIKFTDITNCKLNGKVLSNQLLGDIMKATGETDIKTYSKFKNGKAKLLKNNYLLRETDNFVPRGNKYGEEISNGESMERINQVNRLAKLKKFNRLMNGVTFHSIYVSGVINRTMKNVDCSFINRDTKALILDYLENKEGVTMNTGYNYIKIIQQIAKDK